jgi:hypothetical protein
VRVSSRLLLLLLLMMMMMMMVVVVVVVMVVMVLPLILQLRQRPSPPLVPTRRKQTRNIIQSVKSPCLSAALGDPAPANA